MIIHISLALQGECVGCHHFLLHITLLNRAQGSNPTSQGSAAGRLGMRSDNLGREAREIHDALYLVRVQS